MRLAVLPFALAAEEAVRFTNPWHDVRDGHAEVLGDAIRDWDPMTVLRLRAVIEVDVPAVLRTARLNHRTGLAVAVSAGSSSTRLRGPVWMQNIKSSSTECLDIEFDVAGAELGGRLDLMTQLVVVQPEGEDKLGASLRGTIIWRHRESVMLEGDAAQFPTETADLSGPPYDLPRAGWMLQIAPDDLDVTAAAAVRLIVNESHPLMQRVLEGDSSPEAVAAVEVMRWDVARQLIDVALSTPAFIERDEAFEEDSFGWLLFAIIGTHFPGESPRSLRNLQETDRAAFEVMLQHQSRILG